MMASSLCLDMMVSLRVGGDRTPKPARSPSGVGGVGGASCFLLDMIPRYGIGEFRLEKNRRLLAIGLDCTILSYHRFPLLRFSPGALFSTA